MGAGTGGIDLVSEQGGVRGGDSRATTPGRGLALEGDVELRQRSAREEELDPTSLPSAIRGHGQAKTSPSCWRMFFKFETICVCLTSRIEAAASLTREADKNGFESEDYSRFKFARLAAGAVEG